MKKMFLLPILAVSLLAGCNKTSAPSEAMINDFETIQELSLMKFPSKTHADRAKIELSDEYVTHGNKSMKFSNIYGSLFEMHHFFTNTSSGKIDGSNIKSIEIDVFNDSRFDTTAKLIIYNNEGLDILLEQEYDVLKGMNNHLSFTLSKIALENNASTLISTSLVLYTPETNYDKGIGYTFYVDNWHAKMGSEMTEDDARNQAMIDAVKKKIDDLPNANQITLDDENRLSEVANEIGAIDPFYRRIVPNLPDFNAKVAAFYKLKKVSYTPTGSQDIFIPTTEFYGTASVAPYLTTKATITFNPNWKEQETDNGSTQIDFSGSVHSFITFNSMVSLREYDYLMITFHNETGHFTRIWFSYNNYVYTDIPDGQTVTVKLKASLLNSQIYWVFDQLKGSGDGTLVPSTGSMYIGNCYAIGEAVDDKIEDMVYAFEHLPYVSQLVSEDDYIKNIAYISAARELYDLYGERYGSAISSDQLALLSSLETNYRNAGYVAQMSAYKSTFGKYFYGNDVISTKGVKDSTFGFVTKVNIPTDPVKVDKTGIEQAISYDNDVLIHPSSEGYVLNIYNPTNNQVRFRIRNSGWQWETYDKFDTEGVLAPKSWNKIEIKPILLSDEASNDNKIAIFLSTDNDGSKTLVGDWLISSLVGVPRTI